MRITHFAFNFSLGRQCRDRVDDDDINCTGSNQHIRDLKRLFTCVGLRDQQFIDINADFFGVARVERMLGVDECRRTAQFLRFGDYLQRQGRLAGCFRPVNFNHPSPGHTTNTERDIEPN